MRKIIPARRILWLLLIAGTLVSCLPEQKVARSFIDSSSAIQLKVVPPEMAYKFSHKGELITGFDSLPSSQQDSALWHASSFIQHLSDSILLENYMNSFLDELRQSGFNVFLGTEADSFNAGAPQAYLLDISQLQLDEYLYPLEDEGEFYDTIYYKKININAVDFSCWFDLRKAGTENPRTAVLYATWTAYDSFEGRFFNDPFTGSVRYRYSVDSLETSDLYDLATSMGKRHASYLYDFFMNQYIAKHMPPGLEMTDYFHFNRKRNTVVPAGDDRFEILGIR